MCTFRHTPGRLFSRMLASVALRYLDRLLAEVRAVQRRQIEGVEERLRLVPAVAVSGR